jgi:hypothetical protein
LLWHQPGSWLGAAAIELGRRLEDEDRRAGAAGGDRRAHRSISAADHKHIELARQVDHAE